MNKSFLLIFMSIFLLFAGCEECGLNGIETDQLPDGNVGTPYLAIMELDSECNPLSKFYHIVGGTFPPGLYMNSRGRIEGTPFTQGSFRFTIEASACYSEDAYGYFDCEESSRGYEIVIN